MQTKFSVQRDSNSKQGAAFERGKGRGKKLKVSSQPFPYSSLGEKFSLPARGRDYTCRNQTIHLLIDFIHRNPLFGHTEWMYKKSSVCKIALKGQRGHNFSVRIRGGKLYNASGSERGEGRRLDSRQEAVGFKSIFIHSGLLTNPEIFGMLKNRPFSDEDMNAAIPPKSIACARRGTGFYKRSLKARFGEWVKDKINIAYLVVRSIVNILSLAKI